MAMADTAGAEAGHSPAPFATQARAFGLSNGEAKALQSKVDAYLTEGDGTQIPPLAPRIAAILAAMRALILTAAGVNSPRSVSLAARTDATSAVRTAGFRSQDGGIE
jgi:hypothetical protein